jgi:hypothetical protein
MHESYAFFFCAVTRFFCFSYANFVPLKIIGVYTYTMMNEAYLSPYVTRRVLHPENPHYHFSKLAFCLVLKFPPSLSLYLSHSLSLSLARSFQKEISQEKIIMVYMHKITCLSPASRYVITFSDKVRDDK